MSGEIAQNTLQDLVSIVKKSLVFQVKGSQTKQKAFCVVVVRTIPRWYQVSYPYIIRGYQVPYQYPTPRVPYPTPRVPGTFPGVPKLKNRKVLQTNWFYHFLAHSSFDMNRVDWHLSYLSHSVIRSILFYGRGTRNTVDEPKSPVAKSPQNIGPKRFFLSTLFLHVWPGNPPLYWDSNFPKEVSSAQVTTKGLSRLTLLSAFVKARHHSPQLQHVFTFFVLYMFFNGSVCNECA